MIKGHLKNETEEQKISGCISGALGDISFSVCVSVCPSALALGPHEQRLTIHHSQMSLKPLLSRTRMQTPHCYCVSCVLTLSWRKAKKKPGRVSYPQSWDIPEVKTG